MIVAYFKVLCRDLFLGMPKVATKPLLSTRHLPAVKWGINYSSLIFIFLFNNT